MHMIHRLALLLVLLPGLTFAGIAPAELPANTRWYLHADLVEMRDSEVGRKLYGWLEKEVFSELREGLDLDLDKEIDRITLFSQGEEDAVLAIRGRFSEETRDKILALAERKTRVDEQEADGRTYYRFREVDDTDLDGYFSFAVDGLLLLTSNTSAMERLLANGGRIEQREAAGGTLLVLTADRDLMQAGIRADAPQGDSWESQILKHTREAALLIADRDGLAAIEAKVVADDPAMAVSLAGIVGGLIGLQAMAAEEESAIAELLGKTKVTVNEGILAVTALVEPELIARLISE
ncbi:MAG: hypothetical protein P8172_15395 [Gammaproteobacteria bacterium]